jgi:hypothetical protein
MRIEGAILARKAASFSGSLDAMGEINKRIAREANPQYARALQIREAADSGRLDFEGLGLSGDNF